LAEHIERILIVRTDRLGDVVLSLPMLSLLREAFPNAHLAMLLRRYTGEIVEGNPYLNKIIWYDDGPSLIPFATIADRLRNERFDAAVVVHPTPRLAWLMFRADIPLRIGTGYRYYSVLFNRRVYEHRKDARRHELEYNLNLLKELGCRPPEAIGPEDFAVHIPARAIERVARLLSAVLIGNRRVVLIHPASGGSAHDWPLESFGDLARRLAADPGIKVVVTGGKGEESRAEAVVRRSEGQAVSLAGVLDLKELAALCRRASLFISNSTGPLHVAVAVGTPVVGLYPQRTAMSPRRWGPYAGRKRVFVPDKPLDCRDCEGRGNTDCACMASISVDMVLKGARELLESDGVTQTENRRDV
jgi:heptosyltransferase-3